MTFKLIKIRNFLSKSKSPKVKKSISLLFKKLIKSENEILSSMQKNYKDSYNKTTISNLKKFKNINIFGMGGSILGSKAIYNFLNFKKINVNFIDNLLDNLPKLKKKKDLNIIISKSGNTLETILNFNILSYKNKNIFITENKKNYLLKLANKLKDKVIYHNENIGGRYSVLSEVGMFPAELMGYKPKKFRKFNELINKHEFTTTLIENVASILNLTKKRITNSIILNYDNRSDALFRWYQQLTAESLGKKNKGILPVISTMPKDNHSLMQHYIEGVKNNFYTLFFVKDKNSKKIKNNTLLNSHDFLKNKTLNDVAFSKFLATQKVFKERNIPFRSIIIEDRNEESLGQLFVFFILETILLGMAMKVNPYDQPAVELIKIETKKYLNKKLIT